MAVVKNLMVRCGADFSALTKGTNKAQTSVKSFQKNVSTSLGGVKGVFGKFAAAAGAAFSVIALVKFGKESIQAASDMKNAIMGLQSVVEGQGQSFTQAQAFIKGYVSDGLVPATEAMTAYKNLLMRGYSTEQIEKVMTALKDSSAFGRQGSLSMGEAIQSATEGLKNENSILVDNAGVTKNVSMMWKDYAKSIGVGVDSLTQEQKIQAEISGIMQETRFQTGDAAKIATTYSGQVSKLSFSFNSLKIAVGNALIPIAQAVIPSISAIITALTKLANVFAQVSAAIFGKQASQQDAVAASAQKAAAGQTKLADSTKEAGKAAKSSLAGFDELNILSKDTGADAESTDETGVNAALGTADTGGELFGEVTVSPSVQSAVDTIKSMFGGLKTWFDTTILPMFAGFGALLSPQVEGLKSIFLNMWTQIQTLGTPFASWFNTDFITFLQTTFETAGTIVSGLFDTFNKVFNDIWNTVLYPLADGIVTNILPVLTQFGSLLLGTVGVAFTELKKIFDMVWKQGIQPALATFMKIWTELTALIKEKWDKFGAPIFTAWQEAIKNVSGVLQNIWTKVIKPVWDEIMKTVDWLWTKHLKPLVDNILEFVGTFIKAALDIYNKFIAPVVNWIVGFFGPKIANGFQVVVDVIGTAIGIIADVIGGIIKALTGVIDFVAGVFTGDWKRAWDGIKKYYEGIWDAISGVVKGAINLIIDGINGMIRGINQLQWDVPDWVPLIGGMHWGFDIPEIPKLASGAVIPPGNEFMAILGDQSAGTNLELPEGLLRQIIREEGGRGIEFSGPDDIMQLVRLLQPKFVQETKRRGNSLVVGG